jgi:hypothetical protein
MLHGPPKETARHLERINGRIGAPLGSNASQVRCEFAQLKGPNVAGAKRREEIAVEIAPLIGGASVQRQMRPSKIGRQRSDYERLIDGLSLRIKLDV